LTTTETYPRRMIEGALLNWAELESKDGELFVIIRCDIEMAVARIEREQRVVVNTLALEGESAFECQAVSRNEWLITLERLYQILNVEGLG
jgi:hypothetical protein